MEIKTFRAKTMPQALAMVRSELGPEAMVLHTRELNSGLLGRMFLGRAYEIAATPAAAVEEGSALQPASASPPAPSRSWGGLGMGATEATTSPVEFIASDESAETSSRLDRESLSPPSNNLDDLQSLVEQLRRRTSSPTMAIPGALFDVFTDMIEADVEESLARELIDRLRSEAPDAVAEPLAARARIAQMLESELTVAGPIPVEVGAGRVVALVGPTGVGKTTTIAKLAANFRLREKRRVGLITVDTYRIAAVEQLRTYADIIDLPMEVVSTPREMREAVGRMRSFDLVLMDTAGRSPRDEVKIRELRSMLVEASPDEVHLVLSAAASARSLTAAAERFAPVGVTSLLVTKLDEATGLGNLLSLARTCESPFSYLTDGQNVPDDIAVADAKRLAMLILNIASTR